SRGEARLRVRQANAKVTLPMPSAWLRNYLYGDKADLVVAVGSNLSGTLGFERLRSFWEIGQEEATIEALHFKGPEEMRSWMNTHRKKPVPQRTRIVSVLSRGWTMDQLEGYAALSLTCGKQAEQVEQSGKNSLTIMRPLLVASPEHALLLAQRQVAADLPRGVVIVPTFAWSDDAVYFWLNDVENQAVRDNPKAREALLVASCGYGDELEQMCTENLSLEEALHQPEEAKKRLTSSLDSFYSKVGIPSSLARQDLRKLETMLEMIHGEDQSPAIEEEFLQELAVPRQHFLFAQWMGLVQPGLAGKWMVPELYLQLLRARSVESA
ncbi:MAG TPA: hypothetical protein VGF12_04170, partial [Roseateles sp.]|uniref:hypothetical protein n=1 Tax=Roseateles sp. TaxID=1971397 RepID=UPI002ED99215